jgi:pimeloyl-ACP methyl ester carboxylesterase
LPLLRHLQSAYTPARLPVHIIVPSLIGYGFSGPPPLDAKFGNADQAVLQDKLMRGLGFDGYVAQGGDIGGFVAFKMGNLGKACKGELEDRASRCVSDAPANPLQLYTSTFARLIARRALTTHP